MSLEQLKLTLAGDLLTTDTAEATMASLRGNSVPLAWKPVLYPSLKPLGAWCQDLAARQGQLADWAQDLHPPVSMWISGLFTPIAFLTSVLQTAARASGQPLDYIEAWSTATIEERPSNLAQAPEPSQGAFYHGLSLEGARWAHHHHSDTHTLMDAEPKVLSCAMPVMQIEGVLSTEAAQRREEAMKHSSQGIYECPVYMTMDRGSTYVFTAQLVTKCKPSKWVLGGVALLMAVDL